MRFQKRLFCFCVLLGVLSAVAYASPSETLYGGCSTCGKTTLWTFKEYSRYPTCDSAGTVLYVCSVCDRVIALAAPALGHDFQETDRIEPTCTASGTSYHKCSRCAATRTETIPALAEDHAWIETGRTEPTAESEGSITYTCSVCGTTKIESIPKLEECVHEWQESDRIEATETTPGQITYVCQKCGLTEIKSIPIKPVYDGTFMNWLGSVVGLFNMTMDEIMGFEAAEFFTGVLVFLTMFSLLAKLIQQGRKGRL